MILSSRKGRSALFQTLALLLTVFALVFLAHNTATNLERQGIASGFGFLGRSAGFDIIQHLIPYDEQSSYGAAFAVALLNTLLVSILGVLCATALGFTIGVARLSSNFLLSRLALAYIEIVRNVPLLLQLFFWYFAVLRSLPIARESHALGNAVFLNMRGLYVPAPVPEPGLGAFLALIAATLVGAIVFVRWNVKRQRLTGRQLPAIRMSLVALPLLWILFYLALGRPLAWELPELRGFNFVGGLTLIPELVSLLLALTIYTAAFIAEIVRAGILSVSHGQTEAALALGLSRGQTLRLVVIPQVMRVILPPMTSQYLNLTKNSSLAAAIAYPDLVLVFAGTVLMQTGQAVEVIALTMLVYLTVSLLISFAMNRYGRAVALVGALMLAWVRKNLFGSVFDTVVTLLLLLILGLLIPKFVQWAIIDAHFLGASREACTGTGACWVFVNARHMNFLYGFYPDSERWRANVALLGLVLGIGSFFVKALPFKKTRAALLILVYPFVVYRLLLGGIFGLEEVETSRWGGLMVTLIIALVGIVGSLPLGILLALGRRSEMPIIRKLSVAFIELWRGVPLITVLFMASVMLPLFLPTGVDFDKLLRALVGVTLFSSAYMAEVVRGGLQAIPKGQYEAAEALGLGYFQTMGWVVLPQALKKMIPGIVNTFISLFKDTTLVLVIGMFDLLGMVQTTLTDPEWLGYSVEGYVFVAAVFWVFCFSMSRYSMRLERQLNTERRV